MRAEDLEGCDQTCARPEFTMSDTPTSSTSTMATLAKLTSLSTQTLSLLLERQRLQTLSTNGTGLHLPQITRNLQQLRAGIVDLEEKGGNIEAVKLLKSQYERMRGMLGPEGETAGVQPLRCVATSVFFSSVVTDFSYIACNLHHQRRAMRVRLPHPRPSR